jgi:integrase/recombinase XerD
VSEPAPELRLTDSSLEVVMAGLYDDLRLGDYSPKTLRTYGWALDDLATYLRAQGIEDLALLRREHLKGWQLQLLERRLKPNSRQGASTAVRKLLRYAAELEMVDWRLEKSLVSVRIKREKRRHPIPRADLDKILRWVWWRPTYMSIVDLRDRALFVYLLVTAARVNEALQARRQDYSAPVVIQKGGSEKTLRTTVSALGLIQQYLHARKHDDSPWLWIKHGNNIHAEGERLQDSGVREMCLRISLDLQIAKFSPHMIRHTSASYAANKGESPAVIAAWLGHVNLDTVYEYIEIDDAALLKLGETIEQLVKPPAPRELPRASRSWRDYRR